MGGQRRHEDWSSEPARCGGSSMLSRVGVFFSASGLLRTWTRTQEMFRENLTVGCFPHPTPSLAHLARWQGSHGGHRPCAVSGWQGPGVARQAAASALPIAVLPRTAARPYAGPHPRPIIPVSCHVEWHHCQKSPLCSPCYPSFSLSSWKPPKGFYFFTVSIVLPFPEYQIVGMIWYIDFSDWLFHLVII